MTNLNMSMTEFMEKHGPYLGWPPDKVEAMAFQELAEGKDLQFIVRQEHITIPMLSIQEYKDSMEERAATKVLDAAAARKEKEAKATEKEGKASVTATKSSVKI